MFTATLSVRSLLFSLALAGLALLPATASPADPYTVNTQDDYLPFLPSDPKISLRSALNSANSNPGPDEIILPAGIYTLTITGSGDDTNSAGDLDIRDSVTITGAGPDKTIIDGNAIDLQAYYNDSSLAADERLQEALREMLAGFEQDGETPVLEK